MKLNIVLSTHCSSNYVGVLLKAYFDEKQKVKTNRSNLINYRPVWHEKLSQTFKEKLSRNYNLSCVFQVGWFSIF